MRLHLRIYVRTLLRIFLRRMFLRKKVLSSQFLKSGYLFIHLFFTTCWNKEVSNFLLVNCLYKFMCKISFVHTWWGTRSRLFHFSFACHWLTAFDHYFDYNVHITIQFFWCSLLGDLYHHKWDKFQSLRIWKIIHMQYGYSVFILKSYPLQKYLLISPS